MEPREWFRVLVLAAQADRKLTEEEQDALVEEANRLGLPKEEVALLLSGMGPQGPLQLPTRRAEQRELMEAVVGMALADGVLRGDERAFLERIGKACDLTPDDVGELVAAHRQRKVSGRQESSPRSAQADLWSQHRLVIKKKLITLISNRARVLGPREERTFLHVSQNPSWTEVVAHRNSDKTGGVLKIHTSETVRFETDVFHYNVTDLETRERIGALRPSKTALLPTWELLNTYNSPIGYGVRQVAIPSRVHLTQFRTEAPIARFRWRLNPFAPTLDVSFEPGELIDRRLVLALAIAEAVIPLKGGIWR